MYSILYKAIPHYPHRCVMCDKEIKDGDHKVLIEVCQNSGLDRWVHADQCWPEYKKLLESPAEIEHGHIIATCSVCSKPVRSKHSYLVYRCGYARRNAANSADADFYTTLPSPLNGHWYEIVHTKCSDGEKGPHLIC